MKWWWGFWSLACFGAGVYNATRGEWLVAILMFAFAVFDAWQFDKARIAESDDRYATRDIEEVPLPDYFRKGFEPVETPTDAPPLTWADHDRDCEVCRRRKGDVS